MSLFDSIVLGLVQGVTEFIPVSSSAHLIIFRDFLGINSSDGLAFDAILQLATILAVLVYFWKDLWGLSTAFIKWIFGKGIDSDKKTLILAIIVGTIPAVVFGLFLESYMESVFRNIFLVVVTLVSGAIVFWFAEKKTENIKVDELSVRKGFIIGLFQCLALVPGMSRSGMTISGGLFTKLSREMAVKFSFLLSFPIILGSGLKKFIDIAGAGELSSIGSELFLGSAVAFIFGLAAIHFLIKFLKNHSLIPFAVYRITLAIVILAFSF